MAEAATRRSAASRAYISSHPGYLLSQYTNQAHQQTSTMAYTVAPSSPLVRDGIAFTRIAAPGLGLVLSGSLFAFTFFTFPLLRNALHAKPATAGSASTYSGALSSTPQSERVAYVLAQIRYLFSVGSYTIPPVIIATAALFGTLAYELPSKRGLFTAAALINFSIAPLTQFYMFPTVNKRLIDLDEQVKNTGGAGAKQVDLQEVSRAMDKFEAIHYVRATLGLVGSLVGLYAVVL